MPPRLISLLAATLCLGACSSLFGPPLAPGASEAEVIARLGQPAAIYPDGNSHLLSYPGGPVGQYSYMARIAADGTLISYTQVWTLRNFQSIRPGQDSKQDVLRLLGQPTKVMRYARIPYEAWNYGFKESGVWNSQMSVFFDDQGIVKKVENGPDPRFNDSRWPF